MNSDEPTDNENAIFCFDWMKFFQMTQESWPFLFPFFIWLFVNRGVRGLGGGEWTPCLVIPH